MIALHRRSRKRHLVHPDGLATYCGRILHRSHFRVTQERVCDCRCCLRNVMAEAARNAPVVVNAA